MIVKAKNDTIYNVVAVIPFTDYTLPFREQRFVACLGRNDMGMVKYIIPMDEFIGACEDSEENGDIWNWYFKEGKNGK